MEIKERSMIFAWAPKRRIIKFLKKKEKKSVLKIKN